MEELIQLKYTDIPIYRKKLLEEQGNVCAICKLECVKYTLDHQHKRRRDDPNGVNGNGCVRGVLCDGCNRIEASLFCCDVLIVFELIFCLFACREKSGTIRIDSANITCCPNC